MKHQAAVRALRVLRRRPVLFRSRAGFTGKERVPALSWLPSAGPY